MVSTIPTEKPGAVRNAGAERVAIIFKSSAQGVSWSGSRIAKPGQPNRQVNSSGQIPASLTIVLRFT